MPIVFAQPDPVGTQAGAAAAIAGGQVPELNNLANLYAKYAEMGSRQQQAQTAASSRTIAGNQQSAESQAALAQRAQAQQQQIQAQQQAQEKAQAFQAAQQGNAWTFADALHMSRLQAGLSQLKQQQASGDIDQQQYQEGVSQLYGVLGPLTLAKQKADAQAKQQQTEAITEAAKTHAIGTKTYQDFMSQNPNGYRVDQEGGFALAYKQDGTPVFHSLKTEKEDRSEERQLKLDEAYHKREDSSADMWHKQMSAIESDLSKEWDQRLKNQTLSLSDANDTNRQSEIERRIKQRGLAKTEDEHRQKLRKQNGRDILTGERTEANQGTGKDWTPKAVKKTPVLAFSDSLDQEKLQANPEAKFIASRASRLIEESKRGTIHPAALQQLKRDLEALKAFRKTTEVLVPE